MDIVGITWILVEGPDTPFYIASVPVTFDQYDRYCKASGRKKPSDGGWGRGTRPVINVCWDDAQEYCTWASMQTGMAIRLPKQSEWEFAARGGGKGRGYAFSGHHRLDLVGWYHNNANGKLRATGLKKPNELGIYDMSGNVWEWCEDASDDEHDWRVLRGGSFGCSEDDCRIESRDNYKQSYRADDIGFRCIRM